MAHYSLYPGDPDGGDSDEQSTLFASEQLHDPLDEGDDDDDDLAREVSSWKRLPWWKRPSPYWIIFTVPLGSIAVSAVLAPKVAMYTSLVCRFHGTENNQSRLLSFTRNITANVPIPLVSDNGGVDAYSILSTYTPLSDHTQPGIGLEQRCASDPVVQAVVARLNAVFSTSMGVLSCLTSGWWGSLSDRYGRRTVIFVSVFGLFATDFIHIVTARFVDVLPGGYWFILVGFLIEGLCGSASAGVASTHAYLADTTDPSTISRYLSLLLGLIFAGVATGPILGGLLIRSTGSMLSVFYLTSTLHALYNVFVLFVLPESLARARARGARLRQRHQTSSHGALGAVKTFFSPLVVLLPEKPLDADLLEQTRTDQSLFFIAIAYGVVGTIYGCLSYKFQYAAAQFRWTPEMMSYYVSFTSTTRAIFLAGILPFILKYVKAKHFRRSSTPFRDSNCLSPSRVVSTLPGTAQNNLSEEYIPARSPALDLALARMSAGMDILVYFGMAIARTGTLFTMASAIGSFTSGFSPAMEAVALELYTKNRRSKNRGEVGKLFGALSVVHTLGANIIGPALYGFVYFNTVASFPQAIMVMAMCTSFLSFMFLSLVRVPSKTTDNRVASGHGNEEGYQDTPTPEILIAVENEDVQGDNEATTAVTR